MAKAIFLDIDGTLLSFETHSVPCSTIKVLKEAGSLGYLNSATVSINRLLDSKMSLWCLGALFECFISRDKPFHPLTPPSDLRQYAVENRQEIRISQSLY